LQFHSGSVLHWKKFTQTLSYVVCTQARRHVHKRITKGRYGEDKPDVLISENQFFLLSVWDLLRFTSWVFWSEIFTRHWSLCLLSWLTFEPRIRPTILAINFWFVTAIVESKVRLFVKLFDFFLRCLLIRLTWNLSRFFPNSVEILFCNFRKKTILGEFLRNFVQTKAILYRNLWNSGLISAISFWVRFTLKKIHTSTFLWCLPPRMEARP